MSDFNRLFFDKSYKKSLKQADKSFWVGISSSITGLLFFVAALSVIYFANTKTNFDLLNKRFDNEIEKIDVGIKTFDDIKIESDESDLNSAETDEEIRARNEEIRARNEEIRARNEEIRTRLVDLKNELEHLSLKIQRDLTTVNDKYLVIVCLLGGGFLELIAIVNFVQSGKIIAKVSDSSDKNQMFYLVNSIYEQFDDEHKKKVFPLIINKFFPEANNKEQPNTNANEEVLKDSEQKKNGNQKTLKKNKNN